MQTETHHSHFSKNEFPIHNEHIYAFTLDSENGGLTMQEYDRYVAIPRRTYKAKTVYDYRIWADNHVVTKSYQQMDTVLHKYLFTFDPDPNRAMELFRTTYGRKLVDARATVERTERLLEILNRSTTP